MDKGNPARAMLSSVINRAIANGAPIVTESPTLETLKTRADNARDALDTACKPFYCDGRFGAYRAAEYGERLPRPVADAFNAYSVALNAYNAARGY